MEELNKTQIILLTLLVTFVTSIGTGIITVSLLQQVPPEVTHTINRVVERTVEKVVPQKGSTAPTKEVTIVVKEEDSIISTIDKNAKSVVRISVKPIVSDAVAAAAAADSQYNSIGIVVSKDGLVVADKKVLASASGTLTATFADGVSFPLKPVTNSDKSPFVFFTVDQTSNPSYVFVPVDMGDSGLLKLGQTAVELGGKDRNKVAIGRISGFVFGESATSTASTTPKTIVGIETDITSKDDSVGGPLLDLSGNVVGVKISEPDLSKGAPYIAINTLKNEISSLALVPHNNNP